MNFAKKAALVVAAASMAAGASAGAAFADSDADANAAQSPGVGSGNSVQVPAHVPVNVGGNSANVIGALNPAFGNALSNAS
ncbi:chaplin [Streptomyces mesophilus]|uniref:Chaplin n=1 Tax=Streptomyces mesophilus TaxID=1775132 RepID=A0A6G4XRU3_9ACTN|nr:chaplin [Streptomyces mesophilus]NGO79923.1 chaplin [Streptomyces mesophilus]